MKYIKSRQRYEASNVWLAVNDPAHNGPTAYSYDWWCFLRVIEGRLIFNRHSYSVSTARHQRKVRALLHELGIRIDREVNTRYSLDAEIDFSQASGSWDSHKRPITTLAQLDELEAIQRADDDAEANRRRIERNRRARERSAAARLGLSVDRYRREQRNLAYEARAENAWMASL